MFKNIFTAITTSNGSKRLIAILMMGAGILATLTGITLPDNLQDILTKIVEVVGLIFGAWGVIHAAIQKRKATMSIETKEKMKDLVEKNLGVK
jgi:hypothetical protein